MSGWWRRGPSKKELTYQLERVERLSEQHRQALMAATAAHRYGVRPAASSMVTWNRLAGMPFEEKTFSDWMVAPRRGVRPATVVFQTLPREDHPEWPRTWAWACEGCGKGSGGEFDSNVHAHYSATWHATNCPGLLNARSFFRRPR